jgi:hypothetical protein
MKVLAFPLGRLGNAIFRYLATVVFHIVYNAEIVDHTKIKKEDTRVDMNDAVFIEWTKAHLAGNIPDFNKTDTNCVFFGYFQHDTIYLKYRPQIIDYIHKNLTDIMIVETPGGENPYGGYPSGFLIQNPPNFKKVYDTVVHLRLEDFIDNGSVIHPLSIKQLLESVGAPSYCIVVNSPNTELELCYIEYLRSRFNIIIESNDIVIDYHIMRNAKTLICSCSTISWASAFFSDTVQRVYMPNYPNKRPHETFRKPIKNTIPYEYKTCSKYELIEFLRK